jgi:hypothetical protein
MGAGPRPPPPAAGVASEERGNQHCCRLRLGGREARPPIARNETIDEEKGGKMLLSFLWDVIL